MGNMQGNTVSVNEEVRYSGFVLFFSVYLVYIKECLEFGSKCNEIRLATGFRPDAAWSRWGTYNTPPDSPVVILGQGAGKASGQERERGGEDGRRGAGNGEGYANVRLDFFFYNLTTTHAT